MGGTLGGPIKHLPLTANLRGIGGRPQIWPRRPLEAQTEKKVFSDFDILTLRIWVSLHILIIFYINKNDLGSDLRGYLRPDKESILHFALFITIIRFYSLQILIIFFKNKNHLNMNILINFFKKILFEMGPIFHF